MDKEEFKKEAQLKMNELFAKIDELKVKRDKANADTKAEYDEKIAKLNQQKEEVKAKYKDLANASDEKWDEVKAAFNVASESFKEGFRAIGTIFK